MKTALRIWTIMFMLVCTSAHGAITFLRQVGGYSTTIPAAPTVTITLNNVTRGNCLIVAVGFSSPASATVSSSPSATWRRDSRATSTDDMIEIWSAPNVPGGTMTITVLNNSGDGRGIRAVVCEYSGIATSGAYVNGGNANSGDSTSFDSGPITTTVDGCLLFCAARTDSDLQGWVPGPGYTVRNNPNAELEPDQKLGIEDRGPVSPGTYSGSWTHVKEQWACGVAAYIPASAAGNLTYTIQRADLWDNGYDNVATPRQSSFSRFVFTTNATDITVTGVTTTYINYPEDAQLGVRVDGVNKPSLNFTANGTKSFTVNLGAAGPTRTVELTAGGQSNPSAPGKSPIGSFLNSVGYLSTYSFNVQTPTIGNRVLIYGDSISVGANAFDPVYNGMPMLLRNKYGYRVAMEAWGYRSLYDDANTTTLRTALVNQLVSYQPTVILMHIGANDYGLNRWSAATFGTNYAAVLDALHAALPAVKIICLSSTVRGSEGSNSFGNTLGNYRTAIANAASTRPWTVYANGAPMLTLSDLDSDLVHPTTAGHSKYAAAIVPYLGTIAPPPPLHPADKSPADNHMTIGEVTSYGSCWKSGSTTPPCPSTAIDVGYLTRAGFLWKNGEVYHYNALLSCPSCWEVGP